jgi:ornithine cyclodeaminase
MRFIDAARVHDALDYPSLVRGLERLHREDTEQARDLLLAQPVGDATNHLLIRAAWQHDRAVGMKLVTIFPGNPARALPAVQAVYVLFDGEDGAPLAAIDGTALTLRKTAGDSALGAHYLAREDAQSLLMVGAGAMAPHLVAAHCAVRPTIRSVSIWNRSPDRAQRLAAELDLPGISTTAAAALEDAVRSADVVSCATMAKRPLIRGDWLKPGAHLDLVGAFTEDMREADDQCFRAATVFVDSRQTTIQVVGEIMAPIAAGIISENDVAADLYDLCRGTHPGRTGNQQITLFKNGGGGHLDLMTTRLLMERIGEKR